MQITGISSMATRQVLAELATAYRQRTDIELTIESVGGVDAAKRVQAGERFDMVVLAQDAIDKLIATGQVLPGSRVCLVRSPVAVAVRAGEPRPDLSDESALRQAVLTARSVGYSTGPSGAHLIRLFERWGIAAQIADRIQQTPPGVPVGALVASGELEMGYQHLSELIHLDGIDVLGTLPGDAAFVSTFSAGVCAGSVHPAAVRELLAFMVAPATAQTKRRHGMEPA